MSKIGDRFREFVAEHSGEISGLYRDKYWRDGGWNGLMGALGEVEQRYKFKYNPDCMDDGEFEKIMEEECHT